VYHIRILDRDRQIQAILPDVQWSYTRRINQATEITIQIPRETVGEYITPEHVLFGFFSPTQPIAVGAAPVSTRPDKAQHAQIAAFVQVYQGTQLKASGCITGREIGQIITIKAMTEEILLESNITPAQYGRVWDGWDLADVARDLLDGWQTIRVKAQSQWQSYMVDSSHIDLTTEPGVVMLAKQADGRYYESGHITLRFDSGEIKDFVRWDRVRWSADSNDVVQTSIQVSYDGSNWSSEIDGGLPEEIGYYLGGTQSQVYVRINLHTIDTESEDPNGQPVGVTPYVFAVELIGRTQGHLVAGNIPASAGVTVKGLDADHANALQVLIDACEQNGWEFAVWNGALSIAESLGVNRVAEFVLRTGTNIEVTSLGDDDSELCNILTATGPGQGINRLEVTLRDDESIGAYGDYPQAVEFDASTLTELEAAAQDYLDTHNTPKTHFSVRAAFDCENEPQYGLGDVVRVADPDTGIITTTRIMTESREYSAGGLTVRLDLGRARLNLQSVLDGRGRLPKPVDPLTPVGVYARGVYKGLVVGCSAPKLANWSVTECHISTAKGFEPGSATLVDSGKRTRFDVPNLAPGVRYYARLIHVDTDGRRSEPSREVSAVTQYIRTEDLDQAPPDTPVWNTCEFVREIVLRWHPAARAAEYEIRESDSGWGEAAGRIWRGNATTVTLAPTKRSHTYYIRAISAAGVYSLDAAPITLTNATPSTPPQPAVTEFFSCLLINIQPVADNDIETYYLHMTPVDDSGNPTGATQKAPYPAGRVTWNATPGTRYRIEVSAADALGEGSKSTPVYARTRKIEGVAEFAQGLTPPRILSSLPALPNPDYPEGSLVVLTTDHVLYRCTGTEWDASVDVEQIVGKIKAGMIEAGAVGAQEIASKAILADHFAAGSIEAYVAAVQEAFIDSAHIIKLEANKISTDEAKIQAAQIESVKTEQIVVGVDTPLFNESSQYNAGVAPVVVDGTGGRLLINDQGETWTRKSDGKVVFRFDANTGDAEYAGQLGAKVIEADDYKQVPVVDTYNVMDSFDSSHPLEIPIYIDEGMTIHDVRITARGMRYRAYASGAVATGSHSHDVVIPNHTHQLGSSLQGTNTYSALTNISIGNHWPHEHDFSGSDTVYVSVSGSTDQVGGTGWYHGHSVSASGSGSASISGTTSEGGPTYHSVTDPQQYHDFDYLHPYSVTGSGGGSIPTTTSDGSHAHNLIYGIFDDTSADGVPKGVDLWFSNAESRSYTKVADLSEPGAGVDEFQLCKELALPVDEPETGWKWVKFTTTTKGRVSVHIVIRGFQDSWVA